MNADRRVMEHLPSAQNRQQSDALIESSTSPARCRRDDDEWQVSERRYLSGASMALLNQPANSIEEVAPPALLTA
jgi:hypothetical protein